MSGIVLRDGLTWQNLPVAEVRTMVDQAGQLAALEALRAEWQEATGDLTAVTLNLAMLFDDVERIVINSGGVLHDKSRG